MTKLVELTEGCDPLRRGDTFPCPALVGTLIIVDILVHLVVYILQQLGASTRLDTYPATVVKNQVWIRDVFLALAKTGNGDIGLDVERVSDVVPLRLLLVPDVVR